jgi:hypothetical protein
MSFLLSLYLAGYVYEFIRSIYDLCFDPDPDKVWRRERIYAAAEAKGAGPMSALIIIMLVALSSLWPWFVYARTTNSLARRVQANEARREAERAAHREQEEG